MPTSRDMIKSVVRSAFLCSVLFIATPDAEAQVAASQRWQAWVGCWQPVGQATTTVCVAPSATPSSVEVVTIDSGKVASRFTVDASGQQRTVDRDGCAG